MDHSRRDFIKKASAGTAAVSLGGILPGNSDIESGHQSTLLVQLGNIALRTGRTLNIDPKTGHILNDKDAMKYWSREYQPGWEPKV
jgi:hypothetical protein